MAEAVKTEKRAAAGPEEPALLPAPRIDLLKAARLGLIAGVVAVFLSAVGMVVEFQALEVVLTFNFGYLILLAVPLIFGSAAGAPPGRIEGFAPPRKGVRNVVAGAIAGVVGAAVLSLFVAVVDNVDVRDVLTNVSPELVDVLLLNRDFGSGMWLLLVAGAALGAAGGALHLLPERVRRALVMTLVWVTALGMLQLFVRQIFIGLDLEGVNEMLYGTTSSLTVTGAVVVAAVTFALYLLLHGRKISVRERLDAMPAGRRRQVTGVWLAVIVVVIFLLPQVLGDLLSNVADQAGIFLLMALGLNIVVGFAGLLDLGYVAFFAVGAYTTGVLTSPTSPSISPELVFFAALPMVFLAAAVAGIIVGTPVIRMRGDYLAIVTLGFGEITRLLLLSDWLKGTFGGARGVRQIPDVAVAGKTFVTPSDYFIVIFIFAAVAAYVSYALQDSRMGRAWMAMREDETVAEAMGVNIVSTKLWAFVIGAILAASAGAIFASRLGTIFPSSFEIDKSITILVLVIIGGLGSVPGVVVGALILVAVPELLREFEDYRPMIYGAVLIYMMLNRPEGLIPSRRRAQELHEEEVSQDAWLREEQVKQEQAERTDAAPEGAR